MKVLSVRNRQKTRPVNVPLLRRIVRALLEQHLGKDSYTVGVHLVDAEEITTLNESFLQHAGPTDVIAFDYTGSEPGGAARPALWGEAFVCTDEAVLQARRFHTTWQSELVRYAIHGILHLDGYDDEYPAERRRMKAAENRLLRRLGKDFAFNKLEGKLERR
jgi:probable rRNA maturation factor